MSNKIYEEFIGYIQVSDISNIKLNINSINFKSLNKYIGECGILLYGLETENLEIIEILLNADINNASYHDDNNSWTPLMFCAEYGKVDEFLMILKTKKREATLQKFKWRIMFKCC